MQTILETDWKMLRRIQDPALQRLCTRILNEIHAARDLKHASPHEQFLELHSRTRKGNDLVGRIFNDIRRSTALPHLALLRAYDLISEGEFLKFSAVTRERVASIAEAIGPSRGTPLTHDPAQ